jgi:hypothetical protein
MCHSLDHIEIRARRPRQPKPRVFHRRNRAARRNAFCDVHNQVIWWGRAGRRIVFGITRDANDHRRPWHVVSAVEEGTVWSDPTADLASFAKEGDAMRAAWALQDLADQVQGKAYLAGGAE